MTLTITQEQLKTAQTYADAGNYKDGWKYLAEIGDSYADNAAAVTSGNATGIDLAFEILVQKHWENTEPGAYADKFAIVATQHFRQYIRDIDPVTLQLPKQVQIEASYRKAVEFHLKLQLTA